MSTEITEQHLRQMIMEDHEDEYPLAVKHLQVALDQANEELYEMMTREEKVAAIGRLKLKTESDMRTCEKTCELLDAELQKLEEETK